VCRRCGELRLLLTVPYNTACTAHSNHKDEVYDLCWSPTSTGSHFACAVFVLVIMRALRFRHDFMLD
jgi:hypothetical protein